MSGIVGLWHVDGRPIDRDIVGRMCAATAHRAVDGEDVRVDGPYALAHQHLLITTEELGERQPLANDRGVWLALDGRIDNRDELVPLLALDRTASDAACALAAYERWGDGFAERLHGEFAAAVVDSGRRTVVLVRDAIGVRPLYYVHRPQLLAFASEIKALLAHPDIDARPNDDGLADYLMIGSRPLDNQDITCFDGVSGVVPSHLVVVTPERLRTRRYWDFDTGRAIRLRSFDEYVDAFGETFTTALKRRARGPRPVAVSVSGGLDSSSIFCRLETLRRRDEITCARVHGISFVAEGGDADEREFLLAIEREYGVAIDRFPIEPRTGIVAGAEEQILAVEAPILDYMWGVSRELQARAAASGARVLFSGQWGDQVLFSTGYLVDLFDRLAWRRILRHGRSYARYFGEGETRALLRRVPADLVRHHLPRRIVGPFKWLKRRLLREHRAKPWFAERFVRRALRFADRPATIGSNFHSAHARSIYLEARSKYHVECMEWHNKLGALRGLDIALPLLDRDLLAFLMAAPGDMQNRDGVPRALLREAMRGVLPDAVRTRRWKADFSAVVNRGVADDAAAICRALTHGSRAVSREYLAGPALEAEMPRLVAGLSAPDCVASWDLADLYGLETWLQVFLR
ncbi:MAG TPA: asparagine synthase-related protein [Vicinamibacterales bacterium]|nr:asparagine synthase-related protein [Vicinamibacterales bacterium]